MRDPFKKPEKILMQQVSKKGISPAMPMESVTFKDIAVDFTQEEWALLGTPQRKLYRDVVLENISDLVSVGYRICSSGVTFQLDQGQLRSEGTGFLQGQIADMRDPLKKPEMILMQQVGKKGISSTMPMRESHTPEDPIECADLSDEFTHRSAVSQHSLIERGKKSYVSQQCGKSPREESCLSRHNESHTRGNICECGKAFSNVFSLRRHKMTHSEEKPFKCDVCGKDFLQRSDLRNHNRRHTGEKPYKCRECGKAFSRSSYLRQHERIHPGEKLYECHQCGKAFNQSSGLSQHKKIHRGEKPHVCSICGKAFTQSSELTRHNRTHSREKPYECGQCGNAFSQHEIHKATAESERVKDVKLVGGMADGWSLPRSLALQTLSGPEMEEITEGPSSTQGSLTRRGASQGEMPGILGFWAQGKQPQVSHEAMECDPGPLPLRPRKMENPKPRTPWDLQNPGPYNEAARKTEQTRHEDQRQALIQRFPQKSLSLIHPVVMVELGRGCHQEQIWKKETEPCDSVKRATAIESAKTCSLAPGLLVVTVELGRGHHRVCLFLVDQSPPAELCVQMVGSPEPVTFKDIALDFTQEEWALLGTPQRKLYRDVVLENISDLVSVGVS
ncbi:PREDICTED: zinc finger protein 557-like [Myotis brandtii]|uniref:zinc finger protein 557-like n=1 Tax=Myotis brandtii TaxID=109478 RepID=UPI0007042F63|nr:PREDICTED: zinc finger protein 557-like [Myotis brandtii]